MTSGALIEPIAFTEKRVFDLLAPDKQPGTAWMGPVEWDHSGDYSYGLWLQVSPGVDGSRIDDLHGRGAVSLRLDDGVLPLTAIDLAQVPKAPYHPAPTGGQIAYFAIDIPMLQRIASSRTVVLDLRAADLSAAEFVPAADVHELIERFMAERDVN
jgi:hypothetical protein